MIRRPRRRPAARAAPALAAVALLVLAVPALHAQGVGEELERVRRQVTEARQAAYPFLAPRAFRAAEEALTRAARLRAGDGEAGEVLEALSRARGALARADSTAPRSRPLLTDGLAARSTAREAGAADAAPEAWREAEDDLREAGRAAEEGEAPEARRQAARAVDRYRAAALRALERRILGDARRARDSARDREAPRRAPRTWSRATEALGRATSRLETAVGGDVDEAAVAAARAAADSARAVFRRAGRLAALADSVRERDGALEAAMLAREEAVLRIARRLGVQTAPADGVEAEADAVLSALARRADSVAALRARLDSARRRAGRAADRADSLSVRVSGLEARLDSVSTRLRRRRERERRIREVKALFSGEDGRVVVADDTVVVRLPGLSFEPGEAELPEGSEPLLTRVRSAIRAFPGAGVVVEGHTDARGDEDRNRALSHERAIAVREHLLLHLPISSDRIQAVGRGESRPVASNDTEEGRARNRRIEVVLALPPLAGNGGG